jgi:hypothetical protein
VVNVSRFRKEIDHALERIAAIEKQLGKQQEDCGVVRHMETQSINDASID